MRTLLRAGALIGLAGAAVAGLFSDWKSSELVAGAGRAVCLSSSGNVFVAGSRSLTGAGLAAAVWKYSPQGTLFFTRTLFAAPGEARTVCAATAGGVIVGGTVLTLTSTGSDAWLAWMDAFGTTVWLSTFHGPAAGENTVNGAVVDAVSGRIAVTGVTTMTPAQGADLWVALISATGGIFSQYVWADPLNQDDGGRGVAVDAAGNVYVAGTVTKLSAQKKDLWVGKFSPTSPALTLLWSLTLNGAGSATDYGTGVALDAAGNVVVTGALTGPQGTTDILVAAIANGSTFLSDGTVLWARTIDGGEQDTDEATAIAADAAGSVFVTGAVDRFGGGFQNVWIAKFAPGGATIWEADFDGPLRDDDRGLGVALDPLGDLYLAGMNTTLTVGPVMVVERLRDYTAPAVAPATWTAARAMPNPFRPGHGGPQDAAGITFRPVTAGSVARVYTPAGSLVIELKDSDNDGIIFWDAKTPDGTNVVSGVYVYVIAPPSGAVSRGKVVIIR